MQTLTLCGIELAKPKTADDFHHLQQLLDQMTGQLDQLSQQAVDASAESVGLGEVLAGLAERLEQEQQEGSADRRALAGELLDYLNGEEAAANAGEAFFEVLAGEKLLDLKEQIDPTQRYHGSYLHTVIDHLMHQISHQDN